MFFLFGATSRRLGFRFDTDSFLPPLSLSLRFFCAPPPPADRHPRSAISLCLSSRPLVSLPSSPTPTPTSAPHQLRHASQYHDDMFRSPSVRYSAYVRPDLRVIVAE